MSSDNQINNQIQRIKEKLDNLRRADSKLITFGAQQHEFKLNEILDSEAISAFEKQYNIKLPSGYSDFLQQVGNGGAGPAYGLTKLEDSLFSDMDLRKEENKVNPSLPFPHTAPQIMMTEEYDSEDFDEDEFYAKWNEPQHEYGLLRLCNEGCGIFVNLIVNGKEYGNMWIDDRGSDAGIYPFSKTNDLSKRVNFLDWYELWLDQSIKQLTKNK